MSTLTQLAQALKAAALDQGFDLAGIAPVSQAVLPEAAAFSGWVEAGHAGEMKYLEKRDEQGNLRRVTVRNSAPWARSVLVCALNYNTDQPYSTKVFGSDGGNNRSDRGRRRVGVQNADRGNREGQEDRKANIDRQENIGHDGSAGDKADQGWISRYAWGSCDYHDALMPRLRRVEAELHKLCAQDGLRPDTRCYVDTGPLLERVYAKYAGVGWIGKNTCIIHPKLGSWLFLGVIVTSLELAADAPQPDRCGSCTRCIDACPTEAFLAPGQMDARRCIAYLTIEKRGSIAEDLRAKMGAHVFGCDICQDVCPWNNKAGNAPGSSLPEFQARNGLFNPKLGWLAAMTEDNYRTTFRGSPVKRAKFAGLKRNVAIAMGNSGNRAFLPALEKLAASDDPVVAEHARWAMERLG